MMRYNKNINSYILLVWIMLLLLTFSFKVSAQSCKVELASLAGSYEGACKNGFANGKGEAIGVHHYTGFFKKGLPDGKGAYYFNDNTYYSGNFQDGIKEGKGEMHFIRKNLPDSIIKGYWSGDEYKGKVYKTHSFITSETFDSYDITPTEQSGNSITIDLSTTTGAPNGTRISLTGAAKSGFILSLSDIISTNNCVLTKVVSNTTTSKSSYTYTLSKFPAILFLTLSNGRTIDLELYKAAKWNIRLYLNK